MAGGLFTDPPDYGCCLIPDNLDLFSNPIPTISEVSGSIPGATSNASGSSNVATGDLIAMANASGDSSAQARVI